MEALRSQRPVAAPTLFLTSVLVLFPAVVLIVAPAAKASTAPSSPQAAAALLAIQQSHLVAPDSAADHSFGSSIALSGETALVGAMQDDMEGYPEEGSAWTYLLDATAPATVVSCTPAANTAGWCNRPVVVSLAGTYALIGLAGTEHRQAGAAGWTPYTAPFAVSTQGVTNWEFRSTDLVRNLEAAQGFVVRIDSKKPTTKACAAGVKKGKKVKPTYKIADATPGYEQATVSFKIHKGKKLRKTIEVKGAVACNAKKRYTWHCTLAKGRYTLKVFATDIAGNAQSTVGSVRLTVR